MDYNKYYDIRLDGSYIVHFPNNKGFDKSEIEKVFSTFGKVLSVDDRGQAYGLCFVKYQKLEDVKRCIDGLQNHNYIKILPHKHKTKQVRKNDILKQKVSNNSSKNTEPDYRDEKKLHDHIRRNSQQSDQSDSNVSKQLSTKSTNTQNDDIMDNEVFSDTSLIGSVRSIDSDNHSTKTKLCLKHLLHSKKVQKVASNISFSTETSNENLRKYEKVIDVDEIPALISAEQKHGVCNTTISTSSSIISAQEVIVANIHPCLSIHYILHLFEKFNPIAVSFMMTIPKTGIRYCYVYYKTFEDAFSTMKEFDAYTLYGKNLIVLTSQKLVEEASLS